LKEEALDRILWKTYFGRGYGFVVREATELMNEFACFFTCKIGWFYRAIAVKQ